MNTTELVEALRPLVGREITVLQGGKSYSYPVIAVCTLPEDVREHPDYNVMIQRTPTDGFVLPAAQVDAVVWSRDGGEVDLVIPGGKIKRILVGTPKESNDDKTTS